MEGGIVWCMRHVWYRWCRWVLKERAELHCNHDYKEESGKRCLNKCESKEASKKETFNSPTDLRILSHFTSSIIDRMSYKVTKDLFSKACKRARLEHCYGRSRPAYSTTHLNFKIDLFARTLLFIFPTVNIHLDAV